MLKIDNNLLQELGLQALPEAEKNSFLKHIYETLEMRVGIRLADQMSNDQLDEFERYFETKDDAGAFKWLETNFPNYKDIVQEEFDKLKAEVAQSASQILATSQAGQAQTLARAAAAAGPAAASPTQPVPPLSAAPAPAYPDQSPPNYASPATPATGPYQSPYQSPPTAPPATSLPPSAPQAPTTPPSGPVYSDPSADTSTPMPPPQ